MILLFTGFHPEAKPGIAEFAAMQEELERRVGRPVDLVEKQAIARSRNYIRRRHILRHV